MDLEDVKMMRKDGKRQRNKLVGWKYLAYDFVERRSENRIVGF